MAIWFRQYKISDLGPMARNTMLEAMGIEVTEIGENTLSGKMPIDKRTVQPMGILHGGASAALAETLGSLASYMMIDPEKQVCVGTSLFANHVRPGRSGYAHGKAELLHHGRTTHLWNISISDDAGRLLCHARLTIAILNKES